MSNAPGSRAWFLTLTFKLTDDETTDLLRKHTCCTDLFESFKMNHFVSWTGSFDSRVDKCYFGQDQVW